MHHFLETNSAIKILYFQWYIIKIKVFICFITGEKVTTTLVYKNISFLFINYETSKWLCERGSWSGTARLQHIFLFTLRWDTFSESLTSSCFFHGRLIQGQFSPLNGMFLLTADWLLSMLTDCWLLRVENFRCYILFQRPISLMSRVFTNGLGDWSSIPGQVIPKTQKMVLDATLLNTQHYKVRIKWSNPRNKIAPSPTPWCSSYWKGSLQVTLN